MKWLQMIIIGSLLGIGTCNINVPEPPSQTVYDVVYVYDYYDEIIYIGW